MTTLSKIINFSGVTTIKTSFTNGVIVFFCLNARYLNSLVSISTLINTLNMSTHFGGFLVFPRPSLCNDKGGKNINKIVCIRAASIRSTCARGVDTVKYLRIYLQLS